jgi:colicin import membrane protein
MATLRGYFEREANELLDRLGEFAEPSTPATGGTAELYRVGRELRGAAQIAREDRVFQLARQVEHAARDAAARSSSLDAALRELVASTVADLRHLMAGRESEAEADARLSAALRRWPATRAVDGESGSSAGEFEALAPREIAAIAAAPERALAAPERALAAPERALAAPEAAAEAEAVPVERLCYDDAGAIRRALELRETIERAVASDPDGAAAVEELFDLLRIARG